MTQSLKTLAAAFTLIVGIFGYSEAQNMYASNQPANNIIAATINTEENSLPVTIADHPTTASSFTNLFPAATESKWSSNGSYYLVNFVNDGRKAKASFTKKGKMNYLITDCDMSHLPAKFSKTIKKQYAGYQLFNAIEIKAHGSTAYQAILQNAEKFITLKYTADGVELVNQVKK
jgi:hypothetical protein